MVEDDPQDAELTLAALRSLDAETHVHVISDGSKALDYFGRRGEFRDTLELVPSLVLLDLKMPKVNGLEVLKFLKFSEEFRMIPVVVLSSSRELRDVAECYRAGANAYVVKPMDYGDFLHVLKQLGQFWMSVNEPPPFLAEPKNSPASATGGDGASRSP